MLSPEGGVGGPESLALSHHIIMLTTIMKSLLTSGQADGQTPPTTETVASIFNQDCVTYAEKKWDGTKALKSCTTGVLRVRLFEPGPGGVRPVMLPILLQKPHLKIQFGSAKMRCPKKWKKSSKIDALAH